MLKQANDTKIKASFFMADSEDTGSIVTGEGVG